MEEKENSVTFAWAQVPDLPEVLALLKTVNLPTEGVDMILSTLLVAREGDHLIGCAGLEVYGTVALLRSVAVHPAYRGHGLGQRLTQVILERARHLGVNEVYLITETASDFFPRLGFHLIDRLAVPPAIQTSEEWTTLCPQTTRVLVAALTDQKRANA